MIKDPKNSLAVGIISLVVVLTGFSGSILKTRAYTDIKTGSVSSSFTPNLGKVQLTGNTYSCSGMNADSDNPVCKIITDQCAGVIQGMVAGSFIVNWCYGTVSTYMNCDLLCNSSNTYNYSFTYQKNFQNAWVPLESPAGNSKVNKCEQINLVFSPIGDWGNNFGDNCEETMIDYRVFRDSYNMCPVPPTDILACTNQADCLSKATEHKLTPETWGRGVQQVSSGFIENTQKSLTSSNSQYFPCTNGVCSPLVSGSYTLRAVTAESAFYGQCRGYGATVNTPGVTIPSVQSSMGVEVANRPPVPTVSVSKNPIVSNEEVNLTCDIVDPDECSDKIAKVKWSCKDSAGNSNNCSLWKSGTGEWSIGSASQDIIPSEQSNPYRATAKFKAFKEDTYAITCEAWDNDANNPLSGTAVTAVAVGGSKPICVDGDSRCDEGCSPCDLDCPTCCGQDGRCNPKCSNPCDLDCPGCVIAAGTCTVIRTSPFDNDKVKTGDTVKYQASVFGGSAPIAYNWSCDANSGNSIRKTSSARTDQHSCVYDNEGTYQPKTTYEYKDDKGNNQTGTCINAANVGIDVSKGERPISACNVTVKSGNDSYASTTTIEPGESVDFKVNYRGDRKGPVVWKFNSAQDASQQGETVSGKKIDLDTKIDATVDGVQCASATAKVRETVRWGQ